MIQYNDERLAPSFTAITKGTIFTWSRSYNVSKNVKLTGGNIEKLLEDANSKDYQDIKKCFENNCVKRPSFNLPEEKKAGYCFENKEEIITDKVCV